LLVNFQGQGEVVFGSCARKPGSAASRNILMLKRVTRAAVGGSRHHWQAFDGKPLKHNYMVFKDRRLIR
jgi:hypothetical protein